LEGGACDEVDTGALGTLLTLLDEPGAPAQGWNCPAAPATPTCGSPSRLPSWSGPRPSAAAARSGSPVWPARCSARSRGVSGAARSSSAGSSCPASGPEAGRARPTLPATPRTRRPGPPWAP